MLFRKNRIKGLWQLKSEGFHRGWQRKMNGHIRLLCFTAGKDGHMQRDISEKQLLSCDEVFAEIFNELVFHGRRVVREEDLKPMPAETVTRRPDGTLREGRRDVCKADQRGSLYRVIFGVENQTAVDNTMPARVMLMDAAGYEAQLHRIIAENQKKGAPAYVKGIHAHQRLAPCITVVLYWGQEKWERPLCLHDMLQFPPELEEWRRMVPDYPLLLVSVAELTEEQRRQLKSDIRILAEYVARRGRSKNMRGELRELIVKEGLTVRHPQEFVDALCAISGDRRYEEIYDILKTKQQEGQEEFMSCQLLDEEYNAGLQDGIEKGIKKGIEKGMERNLVENILMFLEEHGHIPEELRETVAGQTDRETLRRWLKLATRVTSAQEFQKHM